jgi:hypothetical protein
MRIKRKLKKGKAYQSVMDRRKSSKDEALATLLVKWNAARTGGRGLEEAAESRDSRAQVEVPVLIAREGRSSIDGGSRHGEVREGNWAK